ncbi:trans-sulfuration enzyme family protein [Anaerocolumna sp. MB42-C2]|uniref:trans-sulfuration enzyme family protein n=1 Tax=Anaerocolumna sp. MB42-C2 TaxID=3070997 RepID=UPI0027E1F368|nr:PLP-dependent aspartate aminotransferase family protein [Anaerocolumna sp. MB42-C2]WMJ87520.1 PLP-dependent aspartate aminotransferase family protein [Anaerocolumna sp. MB42-C2]
MDISTLCIHGAENNTHTTGAVSVPIYQSATFAHLGVGKSTGYDYSRLQNPTREHLEKVVANLEQGTDALAFSTGMAAITALMELFSIGDHIIASGDLYGGTVRLFEHISRKNGLTIDYVNTADLDGVRDLIRPDTKAVYIESPTNPMMQITDIAAVCELAKAFGLLVIVDNTFLTPYYQLPLVLGADIVVHSGTKYLSGHNDTLAGFLVTNKADLSEKLRFIYKTTGACLSPFDSWLLIRGIKTLAVRMDRQQDNAIKLANWLKTQEKIKKVFYIGLPEHPGYAVSTKQSTGYGSMISFEVDSEATAIRLLERIQLVLFAESLGGVETLITYPMLQTHADVPIEERLERGINDCLLRLSVGLEDADDLIADLAQALN